MDCNQSKKKIERATHEQLEFYIKFCRDHPGILAGKNNPTAPNCVQDLWQELANGLNSLRGPTRTAAKWKENMGVWKCQLRTRARNVIMSKRITGGGPCKKSLTDFEELALETFGTAAVEGVSNIPTHGIDPPSILSSAPEQVLDSISQSLEMLFEDDSNTVTENRRSVSPNLGRSMSASRSSMSASPSPVNSMPPSPSAGSSMPSNSVPVSSMTASYSAGNKFNRQAMQQKLFDSLQQRKEDEEKRQERELQMVEAIMECNQNLTASIFML